MMDFHEFAPEQADVKVPIVSLLDRARQVTRNLVIVERGEPLCDDYGIVDNQMTRAFRHPLMQSTVENIGNRAAEVEAAEARLKAALDEVDDNIAMLKAADFLGANAS